MSTASANYSGNDDFEFPADDDFTPGDFDTYEPAEPRDITTAPSAAKKSRRIAPLLPFPTPAAAAPAEEDEDTAAIPFLVQPMPAFDFYGTVPDTSLIPQAATMKLTDMGLGARLAIHYKDTLVWRKTGSKGYWMAWNGMYWTDEGDGGIAREYMRTVIASISRDEAAWASQTDPIVREAEADLNYAIAGGKGYTELSKLQEKLEAAKGNAREARVRFGEKCENGRDHIAAAVDAARPHLSVGDGQFDTDPYLINFQNGTLDLRTGVLSPHDRKQYITKVCLVDYDPSATSEDLDKILRTLAKSDADLPAFLQRYLGNALTGLTSAKAFLYIKGEADAGKSTLIEALAKGMGSGTDCGYARIVSPKVFAISSRDAESASGILHSLRGVRYIVADEAEEGFMNRETVNKLSAGGTMNTRKNYGDNVEWQAEAKIVFSGNDWMPMPNEAGIRRRFMAANLTHSLTAEEMDVSLQDRIRSEEGLKAIFAWAVKGAMAWIAEGENWDALLVTDTMQANAAEVLGGMDPIANFWEDRVVSGAEADLGSYVPMTSMQWFRMYSQYCDNHGIKNNLKPRLLVKHLIQKGAVEDKSPGKHFYNGSQLNSGRFIRGIRHQNATNINWHDVTENF